MYIKFTFVFYIYRIGSSLHCIDIFVVIYFLFIYAFYLSFEIVFLSLTFLFMPFYVCMFVDYYTNFVMKYPILVGLCMLFDIPFSLCNNVLVLTGFVFVLFLKIRRLIYFSKISNLLILLLKTQIMTKTNSVNLLKHINRLT